MPHPALVQNLLSAIGAAPHMSRPNLPAPAGHYAVLGDQAAAFDADLAVGLGPYVDSGTLTQTVSFAYDLARKPS
jgi:hypothetical protein